MNIRVIYHSTHWNLIKTRLNIQRKILDTLKRNNITFVGCYIPRHARFRRYVTRLFVFSHIQSCAWGATVGLLCRGVSQWMNTRVLYHSTQWNLIKTRLNNQRKLLDKLESNYLTFDDCYIERTARFRRYVSNTKFGVFPAFSHGGAEYSVGGFLKKWINTQVISLDVTQAHVNMSIVDYGRASFYVHTSIGKHYQYSWRCMHPNRPIYLYCRHVQHTNLNLRIRLCSSHWNQNSMHIPKEIVNCSPQIYWKRLKWNARQWSVVLWINMQSY